MQTYRWVREGWGGRIWHLLSGDRPLARLERRAWSSGYELSMGSRRWSIRPNGLWVQRIDVLDATGSRMLEARVRGSGADVSGHPLGPLVWRCTRWWGSQYELVGGHRILARFRARGASGEAEADGHLPHPIVLLALGWVVHLTMQGNATVATIVAVNAAT